ncbi:MAG: lipoyl(octanoyl) transferase LipB [Pseudomonadales bacterium]
MNQTLLVRELGLVEYDTAWQAMQNFTDLRDRKLGGDEAWALQHPAVFTLGQAGKAEHVLTPGDIPVVKTDRGGQVTYHGPGQLVIYLMLNLGLRKMGVRDLVSSIEQSIIQLLSEYDITAEARPAAPGVYVDDAKIAALGLRIRRGCSFHGLSINVATNKEHFARINPCGYEGLAVCNLLDLVGSEQDAASLISAVTERMFVILAANLGYEKVLEGEALLPST